MRGSAFHVEREATRMSVRARAWPRTRHALATSLGVAVAVAVALCVITIPDFYRDITEATEPGAVVARLVVYAGVGVLVAVAHAAVRAGGSDAWQADATTRTLTFGPADGGVALEASQIASLRASSLAGGRWTAEVVATDGATYRLGLAVRQRDELEALLRDARTLLALEVV